MGNLQYSLMFFIYSTKRGRENVIFIWLYSLYFALLSDSWM